MNTETKDDYNEGLAEITSELYHLRQIEHSRKSMKKKYDESKPIIDTLTQKLLEKKDFLLYRPMWNELHDRMVYYYDYLNNLNLKTKKTPLFSVTLHNEAVKWWLKLKKMGRLSSTLLHFDTHDDMGLPDTKEYILTSKGTLDYKGIQQGSCGLIYWPVTCLLLSKGITNVIWCMPSWVYDTNIQIPQQALVHYKVDDSFSYIRPEANTEDPFLLTDDVEILPDIGPTDEMDFYHPHEFNRLKVSTVKGWQRLEKMIGRKKKFILDIDLDFFVTNGDSYSKEEYATDFSDLSSTGRVHTVPGIVAPRAAYEDEESRDVAKKLNKEFGLIKKRIKIFLMGLDALKKQGISPCCITISDSTAAFFSGSVERAVWTNSYTPKFFVPAIRHLLIQGLSL